MRSPVMSAFLKFSLIASATSSAIPVDSSGTEHRRETLSYGPYPTPEMYNDLHDLESSYSKWQVKADGAKKCVRVARGGFVRCCMDGDSETCPSYTQYECAISRCHVPTTDEYAAPQGSPQGSLNYHWASLLCDSLNMNEEETGAQSSELEPWRLCSAEELTEKYPDGAKGSGCAYDKEYVWSSESCLAVFDDKAFLQTAVDEWCADETSAEVKYGGPLSDWNVGDVTDMSSLFEDKNECNPKGIGKWDMSKVTTTAHMFRGASAFDQPIDEWNMGSVKNTSRMFSAACSFNHPVNSWDMSNVETAEGMFRYTRSFNQPLHSWNMGKVKHVRGMFSPTSTFVRQREQDLSGWDLDAAEDADQLVWDDGTVHCPAPKLSRRAIFVRWGSVKCPFGSNRLYHGLMANWNSSGSGYNYLCMHPNPQHPMHSSPGRASTGAKLRGVEYDAQGTTESWQRQDFSKNDAACAVCQYQNGAATYVEWGNGAGQHNPSTPHACSKEGHETMYTGLVMGSYRGGDKSEHICVDMELASPPGDDLGDLGGRLFATEMMVDTAYTDNLNEAFTAGFEAGCTVCGIPARRGSQINQEAEVSVYTQWGRKDCGELGELIYSGFIAGGKHDQVGGGANSICVSLDGSAPWGYTSESQEFRNALYGMQFFGRSHFAACAVCKYKTKHADTYIQWGLQACSNEHTTVYRGRIMGSGKQDQKSMHLCVSDIQSNLGSGQIVHSGSIHPDSGGVLLYTKVQPGSSYEQEEEMYTDANVASCAMCAVSDAGGGTVFTRWGNTNCPTESSKLLYSGWMASSKHDQEGGGANTLCMHKDAQPANQVGGGLDLESGVNLLYGMEYQNSGTIDENHNQDAACAVCELNRWEAVYTQWGRSGDCTNGHQTLYSGLVMSTKDGAGKAEYVCVDKGREFHEQSNSGADEGGVLFTTEMRGPGTLYPDNMEVGCSVCAAVLKKDELPFAAQQGNAIHGEWVRLASLHLGFSMSVGFGLEQTSGAAETEEEAKETSETLSTELSQCHTASFSTTDGTSTMLGQSVSTSIDVPFGGPTLGFTATHEQTWSTETTRGSEEETCSGHGSEVATSVAHTTAQEASWSDSNTESTERQFELDGSPPAGTPESATIQAHGVHLWQWQWTILDRSKEATYKAKARSNFLFSPRHPEESNPRRPCCYPGQEFNQWTPFHCKSKAGTLPGADKMAHCAVGRPENSAAHLANYTNQKVYAWLGTLNLTGSYNSTVSSRGLNKKAFEALVKIVDKASIHHGDSDSTRALELVQNTFDVGDHIGDAFIIMDALPALLKDHEKLA